MVLAGRRGDLDGRRDPRLPDRLGRPPRARPHPRRPPLRRSTRDSDRQSLEGSGLGTESYRVWSSPASPPTWDLRWAPQCRSMHTLRVKIILHLSYPHPLFSSGSTDRGRPTQDFADGPPGGHHAPDLRRSSPSCTRRARCSSRWRWRSCSASLLVPISRQFERLKLPRVVAVVLTVLLVLGGLGAIGYGKVGQQLDSLADNLPEYEQKIKDKIEGMQPTQAGAITKVTDVAKDVSKSLSPDPRRRDPGGPDRPHRARTSASRCRSSSAPTLRGWARPSSS